MRRTYAWRDGKLVELTTAQVDELPYVQDDIKEFRNTDGTQIRGKAQWREHLKQTGTIELGHSDIAIAQEKWGKKRAAFQDRIAKAKGLVMAVDAPSGEIRERGDRTRVNAEVMNRLDGRPAPERRELIKIALETARKYGRS